MSLLLSRQVVAPGRQSGRGASLAICIAAVSFPVLGASPPSTSRDTQTTNLEEIIVTAQKQRERLQDVPVPVTAISAETLVSSNQLRVEDYYQQIPGLGLTLTGNGNEPEINIRGMVTGPTSPTTGIVIDEVSYGRSVLAGTTVTVPDIDPGDLARVEVLRGPQGTLYGAASLGGLLKFVTVDPSTEGLSGRLQVGSTSVRYGDDLGYSVRGGVNVPLNDTLAVRLSGFTVRDPGYIDNPETGEKDVNERESDGGRLSALWRPSEAFSLKLSALFQDSERLGPSEFDPSLGDDPQRPSLPGTGGYERKSNAYSATLNATLGKVELISATGYSVDDIVNSVDFTFAFGPLPGIIFGVPRASGVTEGRTEKFSEEVRIQVPIGERVKWLFGLFYTEEEIDSQTSVYANENDGSAAGLLLRNTLLPDTSFKERAAFTNLTVQITDRFDVQFGGRASKNEQVLALQRDGVLFGGLANVPARSSEDDSFTYLVTPRFKVTPDLMTYLRVASGYRPGGPNLNCGLPSVPCEFDPDSTQNYEIGVKGSAAGGSFSYDASVYYTDWKDIQLSPLFVNGIDYIGNGSRAKSQGIEFSMQARPFSGTSLSFWVAYNEAELTEPFPTGSLVAGNKGDRLPFSAKESGGISVEQEFSLWSSFDGVGFAGAAANYIGERRGVFIPSVLVGAVDRSTFPSYAEVDLKAGIRSDTWTLNAFVNNLTDKRGILRGGFDAFPGTISTIQPRTIGVALSKDF